MGQRHGSPYIWILLGPDKLCFFSPYFILEFLKNVPIILKKIQLFDGGLTPPCFVPEIYLGKLAPMPTVGPVYRCLLIII